MPSRRQLAVSLAVGLAAPAACMKLDTTGPDIPANAIVYVMSARTLSALSYHFIDTAQSSIPNLRNDTELTWLTDRGFAGINCIGLVPRTATDTVGTFVFVSNGLNVGVLQLRVGPTTDTVPGYFLPVPSLGTRGSYVVDSSGRLTFSWADGTATQYFDPTADIRLRNDTISSHAELSARGDSVHASWRVSWVRSTCQ